MTVEKYRQAPVVIEAIHFVDLESGQEILEWIGDECDARLILGEDDEVLGLEIQTLEGHVIGSLNDYIVKGVAGEFYPRKPEIFADSHLMIGDALPREQLSMPWPVRVPEGTPITTEMLKEAWTEFMTPLQLAGRGNEENVRTLLTVIRHVYGGMQS